MMKLFIVARQLSLKCSPTEVMIVVDHLVVEDGLVGLAGMVHHQWMMDTRTATDFQMM